jgi:hypothetical protein
LHCNTLHPARRGRSLRRTQKCEKNRDVAPYSPRPHHQFPGRAKAPLWNIYMKPSRPPPSAGGFRHFNGDELCEERLNQRTLPLFVSREHLFPYENNT